MQLPRLAVGVLLTATFAGAQIAGSAVDSQIQQQVAKRLATHKSLAGVQASVAGGVVTLTGTVNGLSDAMEAEHDARHVDHVSGVIDHIDVNAPSVDDATLAKQIQDRLTYSREGMGQTFNAIGVDVHGGVVTLTGQVRDYPDRDAAIDIVQETKGVRGLIDHIDVAPLSPMDDQIRLEAARRIYGNPDLARYAIDPAHSIRIVVENSRITLVGVVQSQVDKQVAGAAVANMPGVLGVTNDLVVAGSGH